MNSTDFLVTRRPQLAAIKQFPEVKFANYERRLAELQATLQRVQQAYLGTSHRAIIVLEGWERWRRAPAGLGPRSAQLQGACDCRADPTREVAALPPALLGTPPREWADRRVRPFLVRPRFGRACRGLCYAYGMAPCL